MDGEEAASEITLDNLITQFKITATILTTLLPIKHLHISSPSLAYKTTFPLSYKLLLSLDRVRPNLRAW